ncbi:Flagellar biogenesis protein FliO [Caldanaerovirga acetigignens]|uniref:Flagellar biogenesis protein FliO n=1 Tax=Caldanaerovirga acetigignens TaxID=447595 RepID=A0A1M7G448_9FIRM|nr:flagellar biosynthetic protein FliO [Caldanaerovirga acetigignens]SHM10966.1 Flagellar biogenesis protein FliO [Caldanaerovirga acetigignens]
MKPKIFYWIFIILIVLYSMIDSSTTIADETNKESPVDVKNLKSYNFEEPVTGKQTGLIQKGIFGFAIYIGSLVLVCSLAILALRWMAKYAKPSNWKSKYMEVLDALYLDSKNRLLIIKSPAGVKVLGISDKGINIIGELDKKTAELIEEAEKSGIQSKTFGMQLEYFLKKFKSLSAAKDGDDKS